MTEYFHHVTDGSFFKENFPLISYINFQLCIAFSSY